MSDKNWPLDPTRPVIMLPDARLQRLMLNDPLRCATLNEYCKATGITVDNIMKYFSESIRDGILSLESVGGEVFIHTAPLGRASQGVQVPPNLWEYLRRSGDANTSYRLWRFVRELEFGGWEVEADSSRVPFAQLTCPVGIKIGAYVLPILLLPTVDDLTHLNGPLSKFARRGYPLVGVVCERGFYEEYVTAIRRWMLNRDINLDLDVLLLERPLYQPILVRTRDQAVKPRIVNKEDLVDVYFDADSGKGVDPRERPQI
ncbi:MAG: hypothetical protein ACKOW9_00265 [Candidatus Paceibacterota bacterium]